MSDATRNIVEWQAIPPDALPPHDRLDLIYMGLDFTPMVIIWQERTSGDYYQGRFSNLGRTMTLRGQAVTHA